MGWDFGTDAKPEVDRRVQILVKLFKKSRDVSMLALEDSRIEICA